MATLRPMASIKIPTQFREKVAVVLADELKMAPADAQGLVGDGNITDAELWMARQKMRAFPSERSLGSTAAVSLQRN